MDGTEQKEKLWAQEDWSCVVGTVHPSSSSSRQQKEASKHIRNQQTKGCRAEVCQAGQM